MDISGRAEAGMKEYGSETRYRYVAKNMKGKIFRGTARASSYYELYAELRDRELYLQRAVRLKETEIKPLTANQLASFCQALSNLLGTGVHLRRALIIMSEDNPSSKRTILYKNILAELYKGKNLSSAMEAQNVFPKLTLGMIRSAEESGNLDDAAARLANHYTREHKLNQQIRSAITYPCLLAAMALFSLIIVFTLVLPEFISLFDEEAALPAFTRVLIAISNFLVNRWYAALYGAVLLAVFVRILLRVPAVSLRLDKWKVKTHLLGIGKITSAICSARFARTISNLYTSGVPLSSAIRTAFETFGNRYLASQFDNAAAKLRNGDSLSAALRVVDGLERKLCSVIQVGEEAGRLGDMLDFIADSMEYDSDQACKRLVTLIEPALIIIMSMIIGVVMIGVMYPIIGSYGAIWSSSY